MTVGARQWPGHAAGASCLAGRQMAFGARVFAYPSRNGKALRMIENVLIADVICYVFSFAVKYTLKTHIGVNKLF